MSTTTYTFDDPYEWKDPTLNHYNKNNKHRPRRNSTTTSYSDQGSLTYSVATSSNSSIHSGQEGTPSVVSQCSSQSGAPTATTDTTSSSFENIKRVLDNEDVASYFQREHELQLQQQHQQLSSSSKYYPPNGSLHGGGSSSSRGGNGGGGGSRSVAGESLAYSTDAESRTIRSSLNPNDEMTATLLGADYVSTFTGYVAKVLLLFLYIRIIRLPKKNCMTRRYIFGFLLLVAK
jgi:hypothetical protein